MEKQTLYIVGAGAIGKVLAVLLSLARKNVIILRGSVDGQPGRTERIQLELGDQSRMEAEVEISTLHNFSNLEGIIVLTNKSFGNEHLARALRNKVRHSPIVILQNGLGVEQEFIANDFPEIYRCVLFATSQAITQNSFRFRPVSVSPIGTIKGNNISLEQVVTQLSTPHFPFKQESDIQPIIWKKAIVNSVFNSVCPLLETDNGIFHRNENALSIARRVINECIIIAREKNIPLREEEVVESLLLISKSSNRQLISTLQDIKNHRPTEIDTLNFALLSMARELGQEKMVTETRLLGELIKLKSEIN